MLALESKGSEAGEEVKGRKKMSSIGVEQLGGRVALVAYICRFPHHVRCPDFDAQTVALPIASPACRRPCSQVQEVIGKLRRSAFIVLD